MSRRERIALLFILLLSFGLRIVALDGQSLWWDELKTLQRATMPLPDLLIDFINTKDQLPLYFLLMRSWVKIGTMPFIVRFFSVLWGVVGVTAVFQLGRRIGSTSVGLTAALLLGISPFHIWYSQETRMYAVVITLLLLAHYALLRLLTENKANWWLLYGSAMACAIYTHYFAFLIVMVHYVFFALHFRHLKQQTIKWFMTMILVGAAFVPWAWLIATRSTGYTTAVPRWITPINWYDPLLTLWVFANGFGIHSSNALGIVGLGIFGVGLLAAARYLSANGKRPYPSNTLHGRLLFLWLTLPIFVTFLVSIQNPVFQSGNFSIYNDRYLIITLPPFLLLTAWGWQTIRQNLNARVTQQVGSTGVVKNLIYSLPLLVIISLSGISLWQQNNTPIYARNDWQGAIAYIDENSSGEHLIIGHRDLMLAVNYYGNERFTFVQIPPPEADTITPAFDEIMQERLAIAAAANEQAWHAELYYNFNPHGFPDQRNAQVASTTDNPTHLWLKSQYTPLEEVQLSGIRLTLYDISTPNQEP